MSRPIQSRVCSKLSIVIEEADESCYWLELIIEGDLLPKEKVEPLLDEANQITAIMVASRKTAKGERGGLKNEE